MTKDPDALAAHIESVKPGGQSLPPVDTWTPEFSGDIDIRITRDGQWLFKDTPLKREAITRLFSTILRREQDGEFYLVTPVEKWRIQVEDAPLIAHTLTVTGQGAEQKLTVTTNMGETLVIGEAHPLVVGSYPDSDEPRPVVSVRHGITARLTTSAFYDLAALVSETGAEEPPVFGVWSGGVLFKIG